MDNSIKGLLLIIFYDNEVFDDEISSLMRRLDYKNDGYIDFDEFNLIFQLNCMDSPEKSFRAKS